MPPQATVEAAKHTMPLSVTASLPLLLTSVWIGVQNAAHMVFGRKTSDHRSPHAPSVPGHGPTPLESFFTGNLGKSRPAFVEQYRSTLEAAWEAHDWTDVAFLVESLRRCWREDRQVFLCGNGGSAANTIHLANDLLYGIAKDTGRGLRVMALPANAAVLTCLANDISYEDIFAQQLTVLAHPGDLLIAFSGSGNSPNILKALVRARELGVSSFAILGFSGGQALALADHPIHFRVHDMQVSEDLQMMVGHMAMQSLAANGP